jgi:hypothetical protein
MASTAMATATVTGTGSSSASANSGDPGLSHITAGAETPGAGRSGQGRRGGRGVGRQWRASSSSRWEASWGRNRDKTGNKLYSTLLYSTLLYSLWPWAGLARLSYSALRGTLSNLVDGGYRGSRTLVRIGLGGWGPWLKVLVALVALVL